MKKIYIVIVFTIFISHILVGQSTLVLNKPESGNTIKEAENSITLSPGFSYSAKQGESFIARIADVNSKNNGISNYNVASTNIDQQPDFYRFIAGTLDVNGLGGAVYTIPLSIPPGTAGMQPNLAVVYNSQSGNGPLGIKWGLSGMSSISRESKNAYYDNAISSISYNEVI